MFMDIIWMVLPSKLEFCLEFVWNVKYVIQVIKIWVCFGLIDLVSSQCEEVQVSDTRTLIHQWSMSIVAYVLFLFLPWRPLQFYMHFRIFTQGSRFHL